MLRSIRLVALCVALGSASAVLAAPGAGVTIGADRTVANGQVSVAPLVERGRVTGFRVTSDGRKVADVRLGPGGAITAAKAEARRDGNAGVLRFDGLSVGGGAAKLAADSSVSVQVTAGSHWPGVSFSLGLDAFDEAVWQRLVGGTLPFHYLVCEVPQATMFYQGGGMIPAPAVDPFPFTATGFMAGEWAKGWSYAPAMAAWAVPAVGMWNHLARTFVAYDLNEQRHTDRSGEFTASAGCIADADHPFFCMVQPAQRECTKLTYPKAPCRMASHFELVYSFELPDYKDPNQFILERLWREKRNLLPPVARMNDLAWIPEYDNWTPSGGIEPTAVGAGLIWTSVGSGLEGTFLEPGAKLLGNDFISDGIMRVQTLGKPDALEPLKREIDILMERCTWVEIGGDRCATWMHPLDGKFRDEWGGERCAGNHHPSTFHIGAAMVLLYQQTRDARLLPYIDGVYNWSKHYLFTRNGVCDLAWAMFSREATAAGENFLLNYRKVFRNNPVRRGHAAEALELARTAVYKNLWFYTADPDLTDDLDPTLLNQATNDCRWAGRVTWNEAGWVLRTMVPVYCESGDSFLKYLLRGSLDRYYAGFRDDGGIAENMQILGEIEPKGLRTGGFPDAEHGGNVRRWARPLAPAVMRVAMGQKAALAFCLGARGYDVADYHYAPETSFSFRVVALGSAPPKPRVDLVATAPFRDLRGQAIAVNGTALPPDRYEFNAATSGEDVFIKGVGVGDVVTIGTPPTGPVAVEEGIPYRTGPQATTAPWQTVDLRRACNTALKRDWWEGDSWYGLTPGERTVWRIPVSLVDPDLNGGKDAVAGGNVTVGKPAGAVFAVIGALRNPAGAAPQTGKLKLTFAGGETRVVDALGDTPFDLTNGFPLRKFDTSLVAVDLGGQKMIQSLTIEGGTLLALALGDGRAPAVRSALAQAEAARSRTLATRTQKYYQTPARACSEDRSESRPWAARSDPWRFRLTVRPAAFERVNAVVNAREDFAALLRQTGCTGRADAQSLYAFEVDGGGPGRPVPVQFDTLPGGDGQRGELLLTIPGRTAPGQARSFDVYFGPKPSPAATKSSALWPDITGDYARVNTGKGGLAFEFRLDGTDENPRWTRLSFASGKDADPVAGANVLGKSGFNGGFADLTCCTDYVKWYDFGGVQTTPARARIVNSGPVATTVMVSGLEMSGKEDAPAGKADWMFRFYPGKPVLEQWLDYEVTNLDNAWTRALQVRYGLNRWERGSNRTIGGHPVACADEVTVAPLEDAATTLTPQCMYTPDGHVLQIAFTEPDAVGSYFTGRWITLPGGLSDSEYLAAIEAPAVEQFGVEELVQRKVVRRTLEPTALVEFDRTGGKGPGPQPVTREVVAAAGNINPDPSFEQKDAFWALGTADTEARWTTTQAYSGHVAVDLSCTDKTLSIACTNARAGHALDIAPNARYEVSFWAKCTSGEGEIQTSFFSSEPGCDFPHIISTVPADGKWHQVQIEVPTGAFRAGDANAGVFARSQRMTPSLRLWTYHKAQKTYVDQVEVRRIR